MMDPDWTVYLIDVWFINRCALLIVAALVDRRQYQENFRKLDDKKMPAIKETLINLSSCYSLAAPVLFTFYTEEWK